MQRVKVNDVELNVFDRGEGSRILFVHGFPLNHAMWNAQCEAFASSYRVIAPDLRGFGDSDVTPGTVTMEQFADDMHALLDALDVDQPITFCGLSMGGYVAWQFVRKYKSRVRALILCDTKAVADSQEAAATRSKMAARVIEQGPEPIVRMMLPVLLAEATTEKDTDVIQPLVETILATDREGIAAALRGMAARPDASDLLPTIDLPTLLIVGEEDKISTVDEMRQMADRISGAELVVVPDAGHMAPMENPRAANEAIRRFLEQL